MFTPNNILQWTQGIHNSPFELIYAKHLGQFDDVIDEQDENCNNTIFFYHILGMYRMTIKIDCISSYISNFNYIKQPYLYPENNIEILKLSSLSNKVQKEVRLSNRLLQAIKSFLATNILLIKECYSINISLFTVSILLSLHLMLNLMA